VPGDAPWGVPVDPCPYGLASILDGGGYLRLTRARRNGQRGCG
jgi:hypothetical protein